jgi:outer membrane immunogenic protein
MNKFFHAPHRDKRLGTWALTVAASSIAFCSAYGADLPASPYPQPTTAPITHGPVWNGRWTGWYVGGNVGYGEATATGNYTLAGNAFVNGTLVGSSVSLDGANGGVQAGYNWQTGIFVVGVEGDIQGADQNEKFSGSCGGACSVTQNIDLDAFGTLRGRFGLATNDLLVYGTGGLNVTHGENDSNLALRGGSVTLADSTHDSLGWTAGGGIEWMFWPNWSMKFEYLHLQNNYSSASISVPAILGGGTLTNTANVSNNVLRLGVNLHFTSTGGPYWER